MKRDKWSALKLSMSVAFVASCSSPPPPLSPKAQAAIERLCTVDALIQPIAVGAAEAALPFLVTAGPGVAVAAEVDQALLHPLVTDVCTEVKAP